MKAAIYKFEIFLNDEPTNIEMPTSSQILYVDSQHNRLFIWVRVWLDLGREIITRSFRVFGTGHEHDKELFENYVGSTVTTDDRFVWHVFEVDNES